LEVGVAICENTSVLKGCTCSARRDDCLRDCFEVRSYGSHCSLGAATDCANVRKITSKTFGGCVCSIFARNGTCNSLPFSYRIACTSSSLACEGRLGRRCANDFKIYDFFSSSSGSGAVSIVVQHLVCILQGGFNVEGGRVQNGRGQSKLENRRCRCACSSVSIAIVIPIVGNTAHLGTAVNRSSNKIRRKTGRTAIAILHCNSTHHSFRLSDEDFVGECTFSCITNALNKTGLRWCPNDGQFLVSCKSSGDIVDQYFSSYRNSVTNCRVAVVDTGVVTLAALEHKDFTSSCTTAFSNPGVIRVHQTLVRGKVAGWKIRSEGCCNRSISFSCCNLAVEEFRQANHLTFCRGASADQSRLSLWLANDHQRIRALIEQIVV